MIKNIKIRKSVAILFVSIFIIFILNIILTNNLQAATNDTIQASKPEEWLKSIIGFNLKAGVGIMAAPIAGIVNAFNGIVFALLYMMFLGSGISDTVFTFPTPDNVIFNRMGFFDPNFINPTTDASAPINQIKTVIQGLYYSCFTIATTIFVVAAMVIGIKLAFSTIASEKAQYKTALKNWVVGLVILFSVHFLMATIFAVNEEIVKIASKSAGDIQFQFQLSSAIPLAGKTLSGIVSKFSKIFGADEPIDNLPPIHGFFGLMLKLMAQATGGDLISAIAISMILFQSIAIVIMYIKRLFYCIFLGIVAPLVVVADVVKKSMS